MELNSNVTSSNHTTKNVIVLPGTRWQVPLVKKLKERGYYVIVFDLYENQPAYVYADEHQIVDILDKERCLEIAKRYQPVAVLSDECDIAVPVIAWISEQLGRPSIGLEMAELYTNKYKMRLFSKEHGGAVPVFYKCTTQEEALLAFKEFGNKMIMKPLDANSSRGIFSIEREQDIIRHFDESIHFSKSEKSVLIEEYITGEEFSVDGFKFGSEYFTLAISKKFHFLHNENLDKSLIFTYNDPEYDYDLLRRENKKYVEATGLTFGLTHAEYKYRNGKYYLIEIGARGGGNLISSVVVPNLSGINTQEYLIDWATGISDRRKTPQLISDHKYRCAVLEFFDIDVEEGVIKEITGTEVLEEERSVKSYSFFYSAGDHIRKAKDGGSRFGYYIVCSESEEQLKRVTDKIRNTVKIILE